MNVKDIAITQLKPYENNPRANDAAVKYVMESIRRFGFKVPMVVDVDNVVVCGHTRLKAAKNLRLESVPVVVADDLTPEEIRAFRLIDNRAADFSDWDTDLLAEEIAGLKMADPDFDLSDFAFDELISEDELNAAIEGLNGGGIEDVEHVSLADRFLIPPLSVLDTRKGYWQERKKAWYAAGLSKGDSREDMTADGSIAGHTPRYYEKKHKAEKEAGRKLSHEEFQKDWLDEYQPKDSFIANTNSGHVLSLFYPVLAEVLIYWFNRKGGRVLDPFAGGSVRGIVSSKLNCPYVGVDLRQEQVTANDGQYAELKAKLGLTAKPEWICGDSGELSGLVGGKFDFILSCPPYVDLEKYSDDPRDLSNMKYADFAAKYGEIIKMAVDKLKDNRFAAWVVGDVRDKKSGVMTDFVTDTIKAFQEAGMSLYNEMILVTQIATAAMRTCKNFPTMRKIPRHHQYILIFYKGDPRKINENVDEIEILDLAEFDEVGYAGRQENNLA